MTLYAKREIFTIVSFKPLNCAVLVYVYCLLHDLYIYIVPIYYLSYPYQYWFTINTKAKLANFRRGGGGIFPCMVTFFQFLLAAFFLARPPPFCAFITLSKVLLQKKGCITEFNAPPPHSCLPSLPCFFFD